MNPQNLRPAPSQERSHRDRSAGLVHRRADNFPRKTLRETPTTSGRSSTRSPQGGRATRGCARPFSQSRFLDRTRWHIGSTPHSYGQLILLSKKIGHLRHDVVISRIGLHRLRRALHVHDDQRRAFFGRQREHLRIAASAGDVVDDGRARIERRAGHIGLGSVDRKTDLGRFAASCLDHGKHAFHLLVSRNRLRPGPGRFAADVDDVGAVLRHLGPCSTPPPSRKIRRHRKTNRA